MIILRSVLCLTLLATLSANSAIASSTGSNLTAGEVHLVLSSGEISALPIDVQALAESHCGNGGPDGPNDPGAPSTGKCRLKAPLKEIQALILDSPPPAENPQLLRWHAIGQESRNSDPAVTSCGIWEVSLSLDATASQPISSMILEPASDNPERGLFASVLEIRASLHLANQSTGQSVDYPLVLGLSLAGPWSWASDDPTASPDLE